MNPTLLAFQSYLNPLGPYVVVATLLIVADFATGMYASLKHKEAIVSHRLRKTIEKFFLYNFSIALSYVFGVQFLGPVPLCQIVAGLVGATELLSIYENVRLVTNLDIAKRVKGLLAGLLGKKKSN